MTPNALRRVSCKVLEIANRPLNARKIRHLAIAEGLVDSSAPEMRAWRDALKDGANGITEVRRGIFALGAGDAPRAPRAPRALPENTDRQRRRRPRLIDLVDDTPLGPLSVEEAAGASAKGTQEVVRARQWETMRRAMAATSGAKLISTERQTAPEPATPEPAPEPATPEPATPETPPKSAPQKSVSKAPAKAPAKGSRAAPKAVAPPKSDRFYREHRGRSEPVAVERRAPRLTPDGAALALLDQLRCAADGHVEGRPHDLDIAVSDNAARAELGFRPRFRLSSGNISLTERGLPGRYLELEAMIEEAVAEQRELVKRQLVSRVAALSVDAFTALVERVLSALGHGEIEVVLGRPDSVLLTSVRPDGGKTACLARQGWQDIGEKTVRALRGGLEQLGADRGLVLAVGRFTDGAQSASVATNGPVVQIVDGAAFASLMTKQGIGVEIARPALLYLGGD